MDPLVSELKGEGVKDVVLYADDTVIVESLITKKSREPLLTTVSHFEPNRQLPFIKNLVKVPQRKTYYYLGTRLKDNGQTIGRTNIESKMRETAKKIGRLGALNEDESTTYGPSMLWRTQQLLQIQT